MTLPSYSSSLPPPPHAEPLISSTVSKVDAILADEVDDDEIEGEPCEVAQSGPRIVDLTVASSPIVTGVDMIQEGASPDKDDTGRGLLSGMLGKVQQPVDWIRGRRVSEDGGDASKLKPEQINNDPLGFKAFLELLHDHPALGRKLVFERVASLKQKWPREGVHSRERAGRMLHKFLSSLESSLLALSPLDKAGHDRRRDACEALEKFVILEMDAPIGYGADDPQESRRLLFDIDQRDRDADTALERKLAGLSWMDLRRHLEGPDIDEEGLKMAIKQLSLLSKYRAPKDKLVCLLNACRVITRTLESSDGGSADDILPVLIWVLIKARPSRLRSNINFIQAFRPAQRLSSGEEGYYFTMLTSAVAFVTSVDHTSIAGLKPGQEAEDYRIKCRMALENLGFPHPDSGPDICLDWATVLDRDIRPLLRDRKPGICSKVESAEELTIRQVRQLLHEQREFCELLEVLDEKLLVRRDMQNDE
ncbi:hypothetical protein FOL47_007810 [Perkinsus chesapeaki]|uniref:VPS9 domain-containing protein n=1 Tax=Perkinsus chesapeaki TaxID=330153 RepID=A0A7J6LI56_PERCH|nr:hypothetical protein FOL47_007810 [Perkinsus chesapeaki]